jgi:hypothetical protein
MKKFAYYLPQFHSIPENDLWWGKDFTEWTNVKNARPLFRNHNQPNLPLNNYFYDLTQVNTLIWQAELANNYCIDGMIFYHYYFSGKKILEKPSELLLNNQHVPMNFFFCWANHNWVRSWKGEKEILITQTYGNEKDWENHFQYLLPFFKDSRYIKEDNKPLFMLFKSDFHEKKSLFKYFNKRCKENGFDGICLIERTYTYNPLEKDSLPTNLNSFTKYLFTREPEVAGSYYLNQMNNLHLKIKTKIQQTFPKVSFKKITKYDGEILFKIMMQHHDNSNLIRGLFFEWDNTPRHGKRGYIITPPSKETFFAYMNSVKDSKYIFINAWNEWSEGMMLEPTIKNRFQYLEWIKEWSSHSN